MTDTEALAEFKAHIQANSKEREDKLREKIKKLEAQVQAHKNSKIGTTIRENIIARGKLAFALTRVLAPITQSHEEIHVNCIKLIKAFNGKVKED